MKRIIKLKYRIIVFLIEITTLILLALLVYNSLLMPTKKDTIYLPSSDVPTLLQTLQSHGYKTYAIDTLLLKNVTLPEKGWYRIEGTEGRIAFFRNLHKKHAKTMEVEVFAGETSKELTKRLANDMKLKQKKLLEAYQTQSTYSEGDIIAGRYILARKANEQTSISYLMNTSKKLIQKFLNGHSNKSPSFLEEKVLLIIASIIQKESNRIEEMPLISSVIYNRLEKGMRLQMDGTLNYGNYAHTIVTPERIKTDMSYYNTYKYKGLPPTPLSTVSLAALEAAYSPKKSDYFFFMLTKDGSHVFAHDYETHLKNVRAFKKRPKENNNTSDKNITIIDTNATEKSKPNKLHNIQD